MTPVKSRLVLVPGLIVRRFPVAFSQPGLLLGPLIGPLAPLAWLRGYRSTIPAWDE